jgi:putative tryptophan/tyrosine transport system substrate-binding protein
MRRRQFLALLSGVAVAHSHATRAQPSFRRLGVLMGTEPTDAEGQARLVALRKALGLLGWKEGSDLETLVWWSTEDTHIEMFARQIVQLKPDVILSNGTPATINFQHQTKDIPVVFTMVTDPVGQGLVKSLAQPGANLTGFTNFEFSMGGKWLGLLKEVSAKIAHVTVLYHPRTAPYAASFLEPLQASAAASSVQVQPAEIQDASDVERVIATLPSNSSSGLVVIPSVFMSGHRDLIVAAAARHAVPAVYPFRFFATAGGLIAYGADGVDLHSRAASYVDRILKGAKPAELPVQQPTKYELVINLRTAKALGLTIPQSLLAAADEVIE